jgi:hypothetical protein
MVKAPIKIKRLGRYVGMGASFARNVMQCKGNVRSPDKQAMLEPSSLASLAGPIAQKANMFGTFSMVLHFFSCSAYMGKHCSMRGVDHRLPLIQWRVATFLLKGRKGIVKNLCVRT